MAHERENLAITSENPATIKHITLSIGKASTSYDSLLQYFITSKLFRDKRKDLNISLSALKLSCVSSLSINIITIHSYLRKLIMDIILPLYSVFIHAVSTWTRVNFIVCFLFLIKTKKLHKLTSKLGVKLGPNVGKSHSWIFDQQSLHCNRQFLISHHYEWHFITSPPFLSWFGLIRLSVDGMRVTPASCLLFDIRNMNASHK